MSTILRPVATMREDEFKLPPKKTGVAGWYSWRFDESVEFAPARYLSKPPSWNKQRVAPFTFSPPECVLGPYFRKRDLECAMHRILLAEINGLRRLGHDNKIEIAGWERRCKEARDYGQRETRIRRKLQDLADRLRANVDADWWLARLFRSDDVDKAANALRTYDANASNA